MHARNRCLGFVVFLPMMIGRLAATSIHASLHNKEDAREMLLEFGGKIMAQNDGLPNTRILLQGPSKKWKEKTLQMSSTMLP